MKHLTLSWIHFFFLFSSSLVGVKIAHGSDHLFLVWRLWVFWFFSLSNFSLSFFSLVDDSDGLVIEELQRTFWNFIHDVVLCGISEFISVSGSKRVYGFPMVIASTIEPIMAYLAVARKHFREYSWIVKDRALGIRLVWPGDYLVRKPGTK